MLAPLIAGALGAASVATVERTPSCPGPDAIGEALREESDGSEARAPRVRIDLSSDGADDDRLVLDLFDDDGRRVLRRTLLVHGASCGFRARAVALIVERYLEALPGPEIARREATVGTPSRETPATAAAPAPKHWFEPRAAAAVERGLDVGEIEPGIAVGAFAGSARWAVGLDGVFAQEHQASGPSGSVGLARRVLRGSAAWVAPARALRLELGAALRAEFVTATGRDVAVGTTVTRVNPGVAVQVAASRRIWRRLSIVASADLHRSLRTETFTVDARTIARVPAWGAGFALGLGYSAWAW